MLAVRGVISVATFPQAVLARPVINPAMSRRHLGELAREINADESCGEPMSAPGHSLDPSPLLGGFLVFLQSGVVVYSPTDITLAECPFALLRKLDEKLDWAPRFEPPANAMMERAARLGDAHEARVLNEYQAQFGSYTPGSPGGIAEIDTAGREDFHASLIPARDATFAAIADGADVVFQASFFDGRFYGRADFLLRTRNEDGEIEYAVVDTKLTNKVRSSALMQMAAYADQLLAAGIPVAPRVWVHHGNGVRTDHRLADLIEVYRAERRIVEALLDAHVANQAITDWETWRDPASTPAEFAHLPSAIAGLSRRACGRCDYCAQEVARTRDVQLVHGIRATQRTRLYGQGVRTIDDLARHYVPVPRMPAIIQNRLRRQAQMQVEQLNRISEAASQGLELDGGMRLINSETGERPSKATDSFKEPLEPIVRFEVVEPRVLRALPAPSPGDLYFDFEGDPMWTTSGAIEGGLEYLFGLIEEPMDPRGPEIYVTFWAHDRAEEKQALVDFLTYVRRRRAQYPDMHIYHYANYERVALERLASRHDIGFEEVLTLSREGVLVDLFPVVRNAVVISQPSYSIKKLEPLYMGDELRDSDGVTNGGDSVAEYAAAIAARAEGDHATFTRVMAELADYNRYDCVSTRRLVQWLRDIATLEAGTRSDDGAARSDDAAPRVRSSEPAQALLHEPAPTTHGAIDDFAPTAEQRLISSLLSAAGPAPRTADNDAVALLAAAVDYHRREDAPTWFAHFERLALPVDWWAETRDVLVVDDDPSGVEILQDWELGNRGSAARVLALRGTLGAGSTPEAGRDVFALYALRDAGALTAAPGAAYATTYAKVTDVTVSSDGTRATLVIRETATPEFAAAKATPLAVTPGGPIAARSLHEAIATVAEQAAGHSRSDLDRLAPGEDTPRAQVRLVDHPGLDVLRRRPPRLVRGELPVVRNGHYINAITEATAALNNSALAVQGPPGTGKTYVGARVITRLVKELGWKIGVVAQSHAVVEHLLDEIVEAGLPGAQVGKKPRIPVDPNYPELTPDVPIPSWTQLGYNGHAAFLREHSDPGEAQGCVIGGTAWDMTNRNRVREGELDLLVIDEAGQFSLANTLAVSTSARRLLLLGDPQQLPQVTQGSHDEPVDTSALSWIANGANTVPATHGYFIERTWRMHPELCDAVSHLSYDDRLHSQIAATTGRHLAGVKPGIHVRTVTHRGNSSASPEEAAEVVVLAQQLIGAPWQDGKGPERPLDPADILVVAAYNAHVTLVRAALDAAGLQRVRAGTVDKFQGQEAAVVLVSLAASSARDIPRGLGFLLNRNRLNVAISRGQWAAVLIHSPGLADTVPYDGAAMADLGAFLALGARSHEGPLVAR